MNGAIRNRIRKFIPALVIFGFLLVAGMIIILSTPPSAAAHVGSPIVATCGKATIDGHVDAGEWSNAAHITAQMVSGSVPEPFTMSLYVMNTHDIVNGSGTLPDTI